MDGTESVSALPGQTVVGPEMVTVGNGTTAMLFVPGTTHEPLVTVTFSVTGPVAAAVKVMAFVFDGPSIVPLAMLQAYVAPGTSGTDAAWPLLLSQTLAGAVMAALGEGVTVTVCVSLAAQPLPLVTVTPKVAVLDGVTVTCCVVAPFVQA